jgi:hypothetical protein
MPACWRNPCGWLPAGGLDPGRADAGAAAAADTSQPNHSAEIAVEHIIRSILHAHLAPSCPHADLCGPRGRAWLAEQGLPEDERLAVERHVREFDRLGEDLNVIEPTSRSALADEGVKRLMTIPGLT